MTDWTGKNGGARPGAGRRALGRTEAIFVRVTPEERALLDAWAAKRDEPLARLLAEHALRSARRG